MKDVLFRGKTAKGEWIYGFYLQEYQDNGQIKHYILRSWFDGTRVFKHKDMVIPETVGQFTGLTDNNCKKIFEGDIVKFFDMVGKVCFEQGCFGIGANNLIDWEKLEEQIFPITRCDNEPYFLYNDFFVSFWELLWNYCAEENCDVCEIIGNIHDNPELLEVEQ